MELFDYENIIYLTFDIDWAHDAILEYTVDLLEKHEVAATFFVTHDTPVLKRLRDNPCFELGLHPNFNPLFSPESAGGGTQYNPLKVISELKKIVPEAKGVRCHALCQSSILLDIFLKAGLIYEVNLLFPGFKNLVPFYHCNGLKRLPFFWEDDVNCLYSTTWNPATFLDSPGLKIFNFHPIHVFLNTENMKRYEEIKEKQKNPNLVKTKINNDINEGTHVFLERLITQAKTRGFVFGVCHDIEVEK